MPAKIYSLKFRHTPLSFHCRDDSDQSVIEEIFQDRLYRCLESILPTLTAPILDIGAHIGVFSIYARLFNPQVKIIALEPEPDNSALLKENLKLNHCKNVTVKQLAIVPNEQPTTTLYLHKNSHNHSTLSPEHHIISSPNHYITVPATTMEKLIKQNKLEKIGLLKMDIEGAEFEIFQSFNFSIFQSIRNIAIEYHEFHNNKRTDLENIIRSYGFSAEHFPNHFDKKFGLLVCRNKK